MLRSGKRLATSLIRDSVFYFLVIFITYLTCLLIWAIARRTLIEVPIGFSATMSCVLANRVVLNVRKISRSVAEMNDVTCTTGRIIEDEPVEVDDDDGQDTSETLSTYELEDLRRMRAEQL